MPLGATWYMSCIQTNVLWFGHNCLFTSIMIKVDFHSKFILDHSCEVFITAILFPTITCTKKKAWEVITCSPIQSHSKTPEVMERQLVFTEYFARLTDLIWPDYENNNIYYLLRSHNPPIKSVIFWQICYLLFLGLKPSFVKSIGPLVQEQTLANSSLPPNPGSSQSKLQWRLVPSSVTVALTFNVHISSVLATKHATDFASTEPIFNR